MQRQRALRRRHPPQVTFFVHENALRLSVGSNRIMHEQILHLLLMCAAQPYRIRMVPARPGAIGAFTWTAHQDHNPVIYVEHLTTSLWAVASRAIRNEARRGAGRRACAASRRRACGPG
jgi:hypothetical protein